MSQHAKTDKKKTYPPPTPGFVPERPIVRYKGQWGFFMSTGRFWALIDQASGPELARRQKAKKAATGKVSSRRVYYQGKRGE